MIVRYEIRDENDLIVADFYSEENARKYVEEHKERNLKIVAITWNIDVNS